MQRRKGKGNETALSWMAVKGSVVAAVRSKSAARDVFAVDSVAFLNVEILLHGCVWCHKPRFSG